MWDCRMVDTGGRTLTAGEEADGIGEEKTAEAGETEAGVVAKATTAPVAEAPDEEVLYEAREGVVIAEAGEREHEGPRGQRLWQLQLKSWEATRTRSTAPNTGTTLALRPPVTPSATP